MNPPMYREYREVKELVDETIQSVVGAACSFESDRATVIEVGQETEADEAEDPASLPGTDAEDSESDISDDVFLSEAGDMARAHWIQLHKLNRQAPLVQNALLYIVENYKHIRPLWQFGLKIDESNKEWKTLLFNDFYFRSYVEKYIIGARNSMGDKYFKGELVKRRRNDAISIQLTQQQRNRWSAPQWGNVYHILVQHKRGPQLSQKLKSAITMTMENMDDRDCLRKLLNEIGAHHYFYDACEPHLEVFEQAMLHVLRNGLVGDCKMDEETEQSWVEFLKDVKTFMGEGIAIQRNTYLRECMTPMEINDIRSKWKEVVDFGLKEAGEIVCERAIQSYTMLIGTYSLELKIPFRRSSEVFGEVAQMVMQALDIAVKCYSDTVGFCNLVTEIREFVVTCMILDMCPSFARKAILEGLFEMLKRVFGESELSECSTRKWTKLYRALEQAIIANIVEY